MKSLNATVKMGEETLVIRISFSIWMVTEGFRHHTTIYCKYLHPVCMVTKGLSQAFYMLTEAETDADHKRFIINP